MADSKKTTFNGYQVEFSKMRLKDANMLFPFVISAMTKIGIGNLDYFSGLKSEDVELFQKKLCENCVKLGENPRNLSLSDIEEDIVGFPELLLNFLEFNFGFFSRASKTLEPLLQKVS